MQAGASAANVDSVRLDRAAGNDVSGHTTPLNLIATTPRRELPARRSTSAIYPDES